MAAMTPRERITRAINHQSVDRQPIDFGGTIVTCIDVNAHGRLLRHLGMPDNPGPIIDYSMGTVAPSEKILQMVGSDVRRVGMNVIPPVIENGKYRDGFGMILRRSDPHMFFDVVQHPLALAELADLEYMVLPNADDPRLYYGLADRARDLYENSPYALFADFGVPGFFETSQKLRGYEQLFCDLLLEQEFLFALWDRLLELQMRFLGHYLGSVAPYTFAVGYADDLGMQDRLQISPQLYRDTLKPYHTKIFAYIHSFGVKVLLHSCGAIEPLMEDLLEAGVDMFNPVQTSASGMDVSLLKAKYGSRAVFWGGIDEQRILPQGTEREVREEVRRVSHAMAGDGGYVLGAAHVIQEDTPPANVMAMFDEARNILF